MTILYQKWAGLNFQTKCYCVKDLRSIFFLKDIRFTIKVGGAYYKTYPLYS